VPAGGQGGDLRQLGVAQPGEHRMQEPVDGGLGGGAGHIPGHGLGHGLAGQRERHVANGGDPAGDSGQRAGPEVVHPDRLTRLRGGHLGGELSAHQVHVGIDAAGNHQQTAGIDPPRSGHGPAELGDPAAGDTHVGLLPVTGRHDRAVADNQVKELSRHPVPPRHPDTPLAPAPPAARRAAASGPGATVTLLTQRWPPSPRRPDGRGGLGVDVRDATMVLAHHLRPGRVGTP